MSTAILVLVLVGALLFIFVPSIQTTVKNLFASLTGSGSGGSSGSSGQISSQIGAVSMNPNLSASPAAASAVASNPAVRSQMDFVTAMTSAIPYTQLGTPVGPASSAPNVAPTPQPQVTTVMQQAKGGGLAQTHSYAM